MKKTCLWFGKALLAGLLALAIATLFCFFYYNCPTHHTTASGATDYSWTPLDLSFRGTEGFAFTKTDELGYVNTFPQKSETVDILIMGSSHTEGFNVNYNENYAFCLNDALTRGETGLYAYNIGTSGHTLARCLNNLENALSEFSPSRYVVIETSTLEMSAQELRQLDAGTLPRLESLSSGIAFYLQKNDFLRLGYSQLTNFLAQNGKASDKSPAADPPMPDPYYEKALQKSSALAAEHGCELILLYSPLISFDYYGEIKPATDTALLSHVEQLCEKHGITLLNMRSTYVDSYYDTLCLPHGFANTSAGAGHLNRHGHALVAQVLCDYMIGGAK